MKTFTTLTIAALALGAADAKVQGRPFHDAKPLSQDVAAQEDPHNLFPHIIGGTEIRPPKKFGFLAALSRVGYSAYDGQFCGGAVVGLRPAALLRPVLGLRPAHPGGRRRPKAAPRGFPTEEGGAP